MQAEGNWTKSFDLELKKEPWSIESDAEPVHWKIEKDEEQDR